MTDQHRAPGMTRELEAGQNTDRELWREVEGDFYAPSVFVTVGGGIGFSIGGSVTVAQPRTWLRMSHDRAELLDALKYAANALAAARPSYAAVKDEGHAFYDQVIETVEAAISKAEGRKT